MKRYITLLIVSTLLLSGCEFIRTKILGKPSKAELEALEQYRLDSIRQDSIMKAEMSTVEDSVRKAREDSIAKADSIAEAKRKLDAERERNKYHVISGSFKTESYAKNYKQSMISEYGYDHSKIVEASNGFNLVSIAQYPSYGSALSQARSIDNFEVWVYVDN